MRTSPDYITKEPELWVIHNSDFSGTTYVHWKVGDNTYKWVLKDGRKLLTGMLIDEDMFEQFAAPIPTWVVGRAVQVAVRHHLLRTIVSYVEDL